MKLTGIILLSTCLVASAGGHAQTVSFSGRDVPLRTVFAAIEKQTEYVFFYDTKDLNESRNVTLDLKNVPVEILLDNAFRNQQLQYDIRRRTIFVSKKIPVMRPAAPEEELPPLPPPIHVKGRILNDKGEVAAVTVSVKGTKKAVSTNDDGYFELKDVDESAVLIITGIGIEPREVRVNDNADLGTLVVKIRTTPIDEVQLIAYGSTSKRFLVGAVTTIKADVIQQQPVGNVFLALQGRVPGLVITPSSGAPGATVRLQVRGQNTLMYGNTFMPFDQPLIIIDGVPFSPQNANINLIPSTGGGYGGAGPYPGFGALSNINPNDVESITVLRDADATSIYGSQGANGVILITTKKGVPGRNKLDIRINTGFNAMARQNKYLNTQQYMQLRREGLANDGVILPPSFDGQFPDLQLFDSTRSVDWYDVFFGESGKTLDVMTSLTGGSENMSYILTAGYNKNGYNFPGDFAAKRISFHSGFHYKSRNNKLTVDFGTVFSYNRNNNSSSPDAMSVSKLPPNTPELLDKDGNLIWSYKGFDFGYSYLGNVTLQFQQYAYLKQLYELKTYDLNNSMVLNYKLFSGLSAMINLGYNRVNTNETGQFPIGSQSPNTPYGRYGSAGFAKNEYETINIEPQLNYQLNTRKGNINAILGATYKRNINQNEMIEATAYTNDGFLGSLTGAGLISQAVSNNIVYKYVGVYGRVVYIHDNKYILNLSGRRDGSSNFGPGQQYGAFGSVGAGWIVSEEKFFKNVKPGISFLKFSANYGTNGSDGVEPYGYQDYWNVPQFLATTFQGLRPYAPTNVYNPDYSWALKKTLNATLDLGVFNDRLLFTFNYYRSRTGNQLVGVPLPTQTGFASVTDNLGATLQNSGLELSATSTNIKSKNFSWTSNLSFYINRNKLVAFPGIENSSYAGFYIIGKSVNVVRLYKYKGVNESTGLFEFYDEKGNPTYTPTYGYTTQDDRTQVLDLQPGYTGGLDNTFTYKGLSISLFFQFARQKGYNYLFGLYSIGTMPGMIGNMPEIVVDRWRKPGDVSKLQRAGAGYSAETFTATSNFLSSDGAYTNTSYLRLKTASISYELPAALVKKAGMESMRIYANAQNLLTFTPYEFGDPEQAGQVAWPILKSFAFGLLFNF